jgi:UDP-N-acetylmuramate dehydrogenase
VPDPAYIDAVVALGQEHGFRVRAHEPMCDHTSFHVGGPADVLADPSAPEHVRLLKSFALQAKVPFALLGAGTNVLVRDGGIRGIVCRLGPAMGHIEVDHVSHRMSVQAGALLRQVSLRAAESGISGMEWAVGIPGNVGGAVFMNAGAHGGTMADVVVSVTTLTCQCEFRTWQASELAFGYRESALQGTGDIVLEATLQLEPGSREAIERRHQEILESRRQAQPLDLPSAGSVFKRPPGDYAGRLIEAAGLKGRARVGGAVVSEKHAGFIVNTGGATAADVLALIELVQRTVRERMGVELEPEVRVMGDDPAPL